MENKNLGSKKMKNSRKALLRKVRNLNHEAVKLKALEHFPREPKLRERLRLMYEKLNEEYIKGQEQISRADKKTVVTFFKDKGYPDYKSIRTVAKSEGLTVNEKLKQLLDHKANFKEYLVCECYLWTTTAGKDVHPSQVRRDFGGVECVRTKHENPRRILLPKELAHTWNPGEIDELVTELMKLSGRYADFVGYISNISGGDGSYALEVTKTGKPHHYEGEITDVQFSPAWDGGVLKIDNKYLRGQFGTKTFTKKDLCLFNHILEQYAEKWNGAYKKQSMWLTYDKLASVLGKPLGKIAHDGVSFREAFKIFEFMRINATLYNLNGRVIDRYERASENMNARSDLCLIRWSGHFYRISEKKIKSGLSRMDEEVPKEVTISTKYPNLNRKEAPVFGTTVRSLETVLNDKSEADTFYVWRQGPDLCDQVKELLGLGYFPTEILMNSWNMITSLTIPGEKYKKIIRCIEEDDGQISDLELKLYFDLQHSVAKIFLDRTYKSGHCSTYSESLKECLHKFRQAPSVGLYHETDEKEAIGFDVVNCFPYNLKIQKWLPIFHRDDQLMIYDGHSPRDYNLYVFDGGSRYGQYLRGDETLYGYFRPHKLKRNNLGKVIDQVMSETRLPRKFRKNLLNHMIGRIGKKYNTKNKRDIFTCEMDAFRDYAEVYKLGEGIWVGHQLLVAEFEDGFLPIHKLVYDSVNFSMWKLKQEFESKGARVLGIITDTLLVHKADAHLLDYPTSYPDSVSSMGQIKNDGPKDISFRKVIRVQAEPNLRVPEKPFCKVFELTDEWNLQELIKLFGDGGYWVVTGAVPGTGKTYAVCFYAKSTGKKYAVACFSNEQGLELKNKKCKIEGHPPDCKFQQHPALTLYKLCGTTVGKEDEARNSGKVVIDEDKFKPEIVIIDELGLHDSINRKMLKRYMKKHPEIQFIATEDSFQLQPIEAGEWNGDPDWYKRNTASMFPLELNLKVPKRYKEQKDKDKVIQLKEDLFVNKLSKSDILVKYATRLQDWVDKWTPETTCISALIDTREVVNEAIHKKRKCKQYFEVGQDYLAMKSTIHPDVYRNCRYTLTNISKDSFELLDCLDENLIEVKRFSKKGAQDKLNEDNLTLPYCRTCHVSQGKTCDGPLMIFDSQHFMANNNWLYVALTRTRCLDEVYIAEGLRVTMKKDYILKKLQGYKKQDADRGFAWEDEDYCSANDILKKSDAQNHKCYICGNVMRIVNKNFYHAQNWTLDRLDNSLPHLRENTVLSCECCNVSNTDVRHEGF